MSYYLEDGAHFDTQGRCNLKRMDVTIAPPIHFTDVDLKLV